MPKPRKPTNRSYPRSRRKGKSTSFFIPLEAFQALARSLRLPPQNPIEAFPALDEAVQDGRIVLKEDNFFVFLARYGAEVFRLRPFRDLVRQWQSDAIWAPDKQIRYKAAKFLVRIGKTLNPRKRGQHSLLPETILYEYQALKFNFKKIQEKLRDIDGRYPGVSSKRRLQLLRDSYEKGKLTLLVRSAVEDPVALHEEYIDYIKDAPPSELAEEELVRRYYGPMPGDEDYEKCELTIHSRLSDLRKELEARIRASPGRKE